MKLRIAVLQMIETMLKMLSIELQLPYVVLKLRAFCHASRLCAYWYPAGIHIMKTLISISFFKI